MFASEEVGRIYLLAGMLLAWQQETGKTLDELLEYIEETFPNKELKEEIENER